MTTTTARLGALGRAELTLLGRNRAALATALLLPVAMAASWRPLTGRLDLSGTGLDADTMTVTGGFGFVLVFVVYYNLVTAYVARREELVLKRLRTGEPTDAEILAGTALPAAVVALAQCAVLGVSGCLLLGVDPPHRPDLLLAGLAVGVVLLAAFAAASSVLTRTVEVAQLTTVPLLLVSTLGSGLLIPLDSMPGPVAEVCHRLPVTPVVDLIRAGWLGGADAAPAHAAASLAAAVVWAAVGVWAVRRWFRWEPRR